MEKILRSTGYGLQCVLLPFTYVKAEAASVTKPPKDAGDMMCKTFVYTETGWDRLKFAVDTTNGRLIPEQLNMTLSATTHSLLFGGMVGGLIWSKNAYINFMQTNYATDYASHLEAKAVMTNKMISAMYSGFKAWTWRFTLLSFLFNVILRTASVYRGERTPIECLGAGAVCGALGGLLCRDQNMLMDVKRKVKPTTSQMILKGTGIGLAFGVALVILDFFTELDTTKDISKARYYKHYFEHQKRIRAQSDAANSEPSNDN